MIGHGARLDYGIKALTRHENASRPLLPAYEGDDAAESPHQNLTDMELPYRSGSLRVLLMTTRDR
ncbi:hypothetical protein KP784_09045 [Streptococcus equi subsp. zooepidemicus]|nr:hypothetical protein [Streptococcus equi subsp. zooepidemicus]